MGYKFQTEEDYCRSTGMSEEEIKIYMASLKKKKPKKKRKPKR